MHVVTMGYRNLIQVGCRRASNPCTSSTCTYMHTTCTSDPTCEDGSSSLVSRQDALTRGRAEHLGQPSCDFDALMPPDSICSCTILVLRGFGLLLSKAYASNTGSLPIGENKIGWSLKKFKDSLGSKNATAACRTSKDQGSLHGVPSDHVTRSPSNSRRPLARPLQARGLIHSAH
jgi:hypothetical protein